MLLINPSEGSWKNTLWHLTFGAYGDTHLLVWADGLDDALEEAVEYFVDKKKWGFVMTPEQALDAAGEEPTEENIERLYNGEFDMSVGHGGYGGETWFVTSYEWWGDEVHDRALIATAKKAQNRSRPVTIVKER